MTDASAETTDMRPEGVSAASTAGAVVPRSVGRVLDLLEAVLEAGALNLTNAAAVAGLTPTTALRHLRALEARGYLARGADGRFTAGPTLSRIAAAAGEVKPIDRLIAAAQPYLDRLAERTGESTYLAVADGSVATYVASAAGRRAIRHVGFVGQNVPLVGSAVGAAIEFPGTAATREGAVESDVTAVSLSLDTGSEIVAAISVVGPAHRFDGATRGAIADALTSAVGELQAHLLPLDRGGVA